MQVRHTPVKYAALLACGIVLVLACNPAPAAPSTSASAAAAAPPAAPAAAAPTVIRLAVPTMDLDYTLPLAVAEKQGYFREAGIEVQARELPSTAATAAAINREIDIACDACAIQAAARGADLRYLFSPYYTSTFQFVVNQAKVREPRDLVGQTIAIATPGQSQDLATRRILESLGVDPTSVNYIAVGGSSARVAGLMSGQVAGSALLPDVAIRLRREGFVVIANSSKLLVTPQGGYGAHVDYLREQGGTVKGWIRAMIKALVFIREQPDAAAEIAAEATQLDREIVREVIPMLLEAMSVEDPGGSTERGLQDLLRRNTDADPELRDKEIPLQQVVDIRPLREAQRELGIRCQGGYGCAAP
jgi:NitT/TauT family transport system substrate-binding protein